MTSPSVAGFEVRRYEPTDEAVVLDLLGASLGWQPDALHARLFAWKHHENAFGVSPAWVATVADRVVGFRTFMRWEFVVDGQPVKAVRAVDTATHPDHRGRGVFAGLTQHALDELRDDGVAFVFNTPNERSRPGYLAMGWRPVRRLAVLARPRSLPALGRIARARTAADKWSVPSTVGVPAAEAFADAGAVEALLATLVETGPRSGMCTNRSAAYLAWRYGFEPLGYRALADDGRGDGFVVFRLRRRGPAIEAAVCEELVPGGDASVTRRLLGQVLTATGADYAVRLGDHLPRARFVPLGGRGPILVCRDLGLVTIPEPGRWHLGLGDVELF
jgi:GNAT superfamily N-acetyltransferase